jgi:hypothetical protein
MTANEIIMTTNEPQHPFWQMGRKYFIRTVTHHHSGVLVHFTDTELILRSAGWTANDLPTPFEPMDFPESDILVARGNIVDAIQIRTMERL